MTDAEWKKEAARLKGAVTRANAKVQKVPTLSEKVEARAAQKQAEEALRQHKLNYHELVPAARQLPGHIAVAVAG